MPEPSVHYNIVLGENMELVNTRRHRIVQVGSRLLKCMYSGAHSVVNYKLNVHNINHS